MHRILTRQYSGGLKSAFRPRVSAACAYQTQNQLKKFRFKRQTDTSQAPNLIVNITDKSSCLEELKCVSTTLVQELQKLKWLKDLEESSRQLKTLRSSNDLNLILAKHLKSNRLNAIAQFVEGHLAAFLPSEKSLIFKLFALIHQQQKDNVQNERLRSLLTALEQDYYDNVDKCGLLDFSNYLDAFYLFRDSNLHFYSTSVDTIFRKVVSGLGATKAEWDASDTVHAINRQWFQNLRPDNNLALSVHILNRLTLLSNDAKSIFFHSLISKHQDRLAHESVDVLASLLAFYNYNLNFVKLNNESRQAIGHFFDKNRMHLVENIDKIGSKKARVAVVDWLSRGNYDNQLFDKYRISLVNYFLGELKRAETVGQFTASVKCAGLLMNSFSRSAANLKNSFYRTYEPIFSKLADKFVSNGAGVASDCESVINFKSSDRSFARPARRFVSKAARDEIMKKYNSLYEYFDLYAFGELVEANQRGELRWLASETMQRFQSNYSYNLNSMNKEVRYLYLSEANKICKESAGIQLSKKVLDSILKEYVIGMRDKTFNKNAANRDTSAAINLILNNHEYSVYKFNMLEPHITNLVDQDLQHINPLIDALMNDFYYETFPGKTSNILNKVRSNIAHLVLNYSDQDKVNLSELGVLINNLFKARDKVKFDSNLSFDMSMLKKNLDNCLAEFDLLCGISNNQSKMSKSEIKNLSQQVKQFETRIFKYALALKHTSSLMQLADDYNCGLFIQLTECVLKLLGIFYDNLFTKVIVDSSNRRNYFTKSSICDLLTIFGLYNYFDLNFICRSLGPAEKMNFSQGIRELKLYNDSLYKLIENSKKMDTLQLIDYNFSLFNLNIQSTQAINDLFANVQSFETLMQKFGHLNSSRLELVSKLVYFMNQNMCLKYPNLKIDWFFKDSRPLLPVDSAFRDVHSTLNSILEPNLVNSNPVYEFNFTANFEIAIDEKNNFVDPTSNLFKYRIPILIVNNSYYYNGVEEFKKPVANYVENFKKLYPLVTVNSSKLEEMKTMKEKLDYIRGQIINGLQDFAEK